MKTSIFKPLYFLKWRPIFDNFYSTDRKTSKLFNGLVVDFGSRGRLGRMCDTVRYKLGHTITRTSFGCLMITVLFQKKFLEIRLKPTFLILMDPSGRAEIEFLLEYEKNSMAIEIFFWKIKVSNFCTPALQETVLRIFFILRKCLAQSSFDTILWYFQLTFKLTFAWSTMKLGQMKKCRTLLKIDRLKSI